MSSLLKELLERSETGDPALDAQNIDIRRKHRMNPEQANREIERAERQRLLQVSGRIKSLMLQKKRFNDNIDKQIEVERQKQGAGDGDLK